MGLFKEFMVFIKEEKKWWLTPLIIVLFALGAVIAFTVAHPIIAPLLYPMF